MFLFIYVSFTENIFEEHQNIFVKIQFPEYGNSTKQFIKHFIFKFSNATACEVTILIKGSRLLKMFLQNAKVRKGSRG